MNIVQTGLEHFIQSPPEWLIGQRLGLLANPASVDCNFNHARELINSRFPDQLRALYSPQHGFFAEKQDNMIESDDLVDPLLSLPVFSLYGRTRRPTREMFDPIDVLIVDLQDVGTRVYTFIYTLSYCLEAAKAFGRKVIVLDRPNPIGGIMVEGNCLSPDYVSFVGRYSLPMRHGLTIGELSLMFNTHFGIGCDLEVIPMRGWRREMLFADTGLPWIAPSPNLPTPASAMVYPGQVIWEGTNISEGRGTTQPFEIFGAPFVDSRSMMTVLEQEPWPGVHLRPLAFEPTSNKYAGVTCRGFQIHVVHPLQYQPLATSLRLLQCMFQLFGDRFEWKQPPYEYEFEKMPIDLILGDHLLRCRIENLEPLENIIASWQDELNAFKALSRSFHLYA